MSAGIEQFTDWLRDGADGALQYIPGAPLIISAVVDDALQEALAEIDRAESSGRWSAGEARDMRAAARSFAVDQDLEGLRGVYIQARDRNRFETTGQRTQLEAQSGTDPLVFTLEDSAAVAASGVRRGLNAAAGVAAQATPWWVWALVVGGVGLWVWGKTK